MRRSLLFCSALGLVAPSGACVDDRAAPASFLAPAPTADEPRAPAAALLLSTGLTVEPPTFSVERGFLTEPTTVALTSGDAEIYFTTDGSTPTPSTGVRYAEPVEIGTTTALRAIAVSPAGLPSPVVTHTYLFLDGVLRQPEEPEGYPSTFANNDDGFGPYPADYEMDPDVVEDPLYADVLEDALLALPTLSIVTDIPNLFDEETGIYTNPMEEGDLWERPVSVELFDPVEGSLLAANVGLRIHGQASRKPSWTPKRGLRIYARAAYGPGRLELPLFGEGAVASFDKLVLRSIPNYSWLSWDDHQRESALYMRDEFARQTQLEMGGVTAHGRFVHTYVNGLYWGIYNLVERIDAEFLADSLGGTDEEWDLVSMTNGVLGADEGDLVAYDEMMALANAGVSDSRAYEALAAKVDLENLVDYLIVTHWVANSDWPQRNWFAARRRVPDGKFLFLTWDSDTSLSSVDADILSVDLDGTPQRLFHALRRNEEFRVLYADRLYTHLTNGGALAPEIATARFRELCDTLEFAVTAESARWGDYVRDVYQRPDADPGVLALYTPEDFTRTRDRMLADYLPARTETVLGQYRALGLYPDTEPPRMTLSDEDGTPTLSIDNSRNGRVGTVYYRLDGGDPREPGGAVAAEALRAEDLHEIQVSPGTRIRARVLVGDRWSACADVITPR